MSPVMAKGVAGHRVQQVTIHNPGLHVRTSLAPLVITCVALLGCHNRERDCTNGEDDDGDNFIDCSDQDCVDTCTEQCTNGVDDDGDALEDCLDPDCADRCPSPVHGDEDCRNEADDDGDWLVDCQDSDCDIICDTDSDGYVGLDLGGPDCDDDDARVHPDALEVPYDDTDNDCDPLTPDDDVDGDGFLLAQDCDDTRAASFPGAPETCGDGLVNDCDAPTATFTRGDCYGERPLATADASFLGTSVDDWTGWSVSAAGDMNNDGQDDLLIGAYGAGNDASGAVYLVTGPYAGAIDLATATVKWVAESEDDWAGYSVAGGHDLSGDGYPDAAIGARYDDATGNSAGAVYIVRADAQGTVELVEAWAKVYAEAEYDSAGFSVASPGDVGGDGIPDLLVGSPESSANGNASGMVHLVHGPLAGDVQLSAAVYRLVGERISDKLGCAVAGGGDLDGDGQNDILVASCFSDRNGNDAGAAFQFSTHEDIDRLVADADGAMVGQLPGDQLGSSLASGDLNNDGLSDAIVGAPLHDAGAEDAGAVYIATGPATIDMNLPVGKLTGLSVGDRAGTSVASSIDLDSDGFDDVIIGAPGSDLAGEDAGEAYVVFGPVLGIMPLSEADVHFVGEDAFDFAGQSVSAAGDPDGDGLPDLLIGAPFRDGLAPSSGTAYLFTFHW